jgi:hypothetical protein
MMRRWTPHPLAAAFSEVGHALLLAMVGAAVLADRVVGVVRSPANVAVGAGMIVAAVLILLDVLGLVRGRWGHLGWGVLLASAAAFLGINFF